MVTPSRAPRSAHDQAPHAAPRPFERVLVANRGEIAVRVIRTLRRLGIRSIAVYSDADAGAPHVRLADEAVRIGPAPATESYLDPARIVARRARHRRAGDPPGVRVPLRERRVRPRVREAASSSSARAIEALEVMGDKIRAKLHVEASGVPMVPGVADARLDDAGSSPRPLDRLPAAREAVGGRRRQGHAGRRASRRARRGARRRAASRAPPSATTRCCSSAHRAPAPHRGAGARRRARRRHPPRRARVLAAAPSPEGHRGGALAAARRRDARAHRPRRATPPAASSYLGAARSSSWCRMPRPTSSSSSR